MYIVSGSELTSLVQSYQSQGWTWILSQGTSHMDTLVTVFGPARALYSASGIHPHTVPH